MSEDATKLRVRCYAFVEEQSCGEWDDKTVMKDTEKLMSFVAAECRSSHEALKEARSCIEDLGAGKGGWAWEEVIMKISEALELGGQK